MRRKQQQDGFTIVELTVTLVIFSIVAISIFGLYTSLVHSTIIAKRQAVGLSLATNQMEYLKSLPYDNLAVAGGSIVATNTIPASKTEKINGVTYTTVTNINYVDDAYDGCTNYPNATAKQRYCRNLLSTTTTVIDTNPQDYKIAHVTVTDPSGKHLAEVDTQISARVSETASSTGALFVNIIDDNGNPVPDATVSVTNTTLTPNINISDTTDVFGTAVFYGLPPDSSTDYVITSSKSQYSSLVTIGVSGTLQPTYPSQKILSQQPSYVTLVLTPMSANSLILETTDTNGAVLPNMKIYVKGGYKKYTSTTDTKYYFDNVSPSDTRGLTNSSGISTIQNLVPGRYIFCDADMSISCVNQSNTRYYLAAVIPYGGSTTLNPIVVPADSAANPADETFTYGGLSYVQKVRLMLTTSSTFPRVASLTPGTVVKGTDNLSPLTFTVNGYNLSCGTGSGCSSTVKFVQSGTDYVASCTGTSAGLKLTCTATISAMTAGSAQLVVGTSAGTLTLPADLLLGGLRVE